MSKPNPRRTNGAARDKVRARLKAEGRVADGMIPKLDNAFKALRDGAAGVVIRNAADLLSPGGTELKL